MPPKTIQGRVPALVSKALKPSAECSAGEASHDGDTGKKDVAITDGASEDTATSDEEDDSETTNEDGEDSDDKDGSEESEDSDDEEDDSEVMILAYP